MRTITLATGEQCFVDDEDFAYLSQFEWKLHPEGYAYRNAPRGVLLMHREVIGATKGQLTDHRDRNKLNNQKWNLRLATHSQNHGNAMHTKRGMSSKFKGVYWHRTAKKWAAQLHKTQNGKCRPKHLGLFAEENEAAMAYNSAAIQHFGTEFALLNAV